MDLNIPLFPFESAAITVTTAVWIGVLVAAFFNLRFGWTFSGLVVAGYLTPLIATRPMNAVVILFESILTYAIVRLLSEAFRLRPYWSSFFGRDRFFIIVVVSILVRAVLDGWVFPIAGQFLVDSCGLQFDYRNNLHSFGLIVIALIANYFWKPGLAKGLIPLLTTVATTYILVSVVLVQLTNFNLGNFHLLYEDISSSLLASPKAYIVVLTTAFLASWMNLKYAWEFNGILIPALLGLLWHDPVKIFASMLECLIIWMIGAGLLKSSLFRGVTMQGSRKLVFFFTICFLYRLILCHLLVRSDFDISESFGFGYLLSTLMAIKIHQKGIAVRMLKGIGQVSLVGALAGSFIGFIFYAAPPVVFRTSASERSSAPSAESLVVVDGRLNDQVLADKILLYQKRETKYVVPLSHELGRFRSLLVRLKSEIAASSHQDLNHRLVPFVPDFADLNYELSIVENRYLYFKERSPANGWGIYLIDTEQSGGLNLQVPAPLEEWATIESALTLLNKMKVHTISIAGGPKSTAVGGSDVTRDRDTFFYVFNDVFDEAQSAVQLRGLTPSVNRRIRSAMKNSDGEVASHLWIRGHLPEQFRLSDLKELAGAFGVHWNSSPLANPLRDVTRGNFVEIVLSREARRRLIARNFIDADLPFETMGLKRLELPLGVWLAEFKDKIIPQGTNQYEPARIEQLLFLDQEVIQPLVETLGRISPDDLGLDASGHPHWLSPEVERQLAIANLAAKPVGYGLHLIVDQAEDEAYVALAEIGKQPRGWGTYVLRPGLFSEYFVEVPRPLFESRSFEFGVNLFNRMDASILSIAGAHPRANLDGTSDVSKATNRTNLFNLVRHVTLRQVEQRPMLIAQVRAIQAPVQADLIMATDDGSQTADELSRLKLGLHRELESEQLKVGFVDGSEDTAGYELGILMQATAVQVSRNKEVVSLWLSPSLRTKYREQAANNSLASQFAALDLKTAQADLVSVLGAPRFTVEDENGDLVGSQLPLPMKNALQQYLSNHDIVRLYSLLSDFSDWNIERVVDVRTGQSFLLLFRDHEFPVVMNLTGNLGSETVRMSKYDPDTVQDFGRSRAQWLEVSNQ